MSNMGNNDAATQHYFVTFLQCSVDLDTDETFVVEFLERTLGINMVESVRKLLLQLLVFKCFCTIKVILVQVRHFQCV